MYNALGVAGIPVQLNHWHVTLTYLCIYICVYIYMCMYANVIYIYPIRFVMPHQPIRGKPLVWICGGRSANQRAMDIFEKNRNGHSWMCKAPRWVIRPPNESFWRGLLFAER